MVGRQNILLLRWKQNQWNQIDESVESALDKHPSLAKYIIAIPYDLPDARINGKQSARMRWNRRVKKWKLWASERQMCVEFEPWFQSDLVERMVKREGLYRFWF